MTAPVHGGEGVRHGLIRCEWTSLAPRQNQRQSGSFCIYSRVEPELHLHRLAVNGVIGRGGTESRIACAVRGAGKKQCSSTTERNVRLRPFLISLTFRSEKPGLQ